MPTNLVNPVSTNPLLVASGASELNGNINGYFLSIVQFQARHLRDMMKIFQTLPAITYVQFITGYQRSIRGCLAEYNEYIRKRMQRKENKIYFLFKVALRNLLKEPSSNNSDKKGVETKDYSPPIWILCTHKDSNLASPKLIEQRETVGS